MRWRNAGGLKYSPAQIRARAKAISVPSVVNLLIDTSGLGGKPIAIIAGFVGRVSYSGSGGNPLHRHDHWRRRRAAGANNEFKRPGFWQRPASVHSHRRRRRPPATIQWDGEVRRGSHAGSANALRLGDGRCTWCISMYLLRPLPTAKFSAGAVRRRRPRWMGSRLHSLIRLIRIQRGTLGWPFTRLRSSRRSAEEARRM